MTVPLASLNSFPLSEIFRLAISKPSGCFKTITV
jgi:hypothetical protein